ncbi:MAG TPA: preprotein translocase subunit SecG [Thermoanaerobaculia bacterium]|jgi:preprotein translocase subunit SecG|nr:preprotein translocase subunit SecG [Thermoanaerobaculia bacterium]
MFTFLVVLYIFVCIILILIVLVQQGRGADLAGAFGGGGSQQTFGPRGATTFLHKLTTGFFVAFIILALALAVIESRPQSSVIKQGPKNPNAAKKLPATFPAPAPAPAAPANTTSPAHATTGSTPSTGSSPAPAPSAPATTR